VLLAQVILVVVVEPALRVAVLLAALVVTQDLLVQQGVTLQLPVDLVVVLVMLHLQEITVHQEIQEQLVQQVQQEMPVLQDL
jgi:hypothetical protein